MVARPFGSSTGPVDAQVLLWALAEPRRLPAPIRRLMESGDAEFYFSLGSIWEIAMKRSLGKLDFDPDLIADTAEADAALARYGPTVRVI
jgi:PIN domain nuclease of toxin-antitoxin system